MQGNEIIIDAKDADASKFRVGSRHVPGQSGGGGAFSFDVIERAEEGSPRKEVAVLVGGFNGQQGEIGICVWNGQEPFGDATQIKVMEIRGNEIEFKVPVKGITVAPSVPVPVGPSAELRSPDGRWVTVQQGDGNLVQYEILPSGAWVARWSIWTGRL